MRNYPYVLSSLLSLATAACAAVPDVTAQYYLPKGHADFVVIKTVGCGEAKPQSPRRLHSIANVTATVGYSADLSEPHQLAFARGGGVFSDEGMTIELHDDGRLAGINSSSTGRGAEIIQGVAALLPFALVSGGLAPPEEPKPESIEEACKAIDAAAGEGKTVSVTYRLREEFNPQSVGSSSPANKRVGKARLIPVSSDGSNIGLLIARHMPAICVRYENGRAIRPPAIWKGSSTGHSLTLRQLVKYDAVIFEHTTNKYGNASDPTCQSDNPKPEGIMWSGILSVPLPRVSGEIFFADMGATGSYQIPIPDSAPFGHTEMTLSLSESGAVSKLQYGNKSGAVEALTSARSLIDAMQTSPAERLLQYRTEADIIEQHQRLIRCRTDPKKCAT